MLLMLEQFLVHRIQPIEELELGQLVFYHEVVHWILEKIINRQRRPVLSKASAEKLTIESNGIRFEEANTSIIFISWYLKREKGSRRSLFVMLRPYFARWKFLHEFFRSIGFVHFELIITGNRQLSSTVLSCNLSFVSTKVTWKGVESLKELQIR